MTSLSRLTDLPQAFAIQLDNMALLTLEGEQADSYLHSQLTINVNKMERDCVRWSAHCDNKGKMWSISQVGRFNNKIAMVLNKSGAEASLRELKKYGVFLKVTIEDETAQFQQFYVSHDSGLALLGELFADLPSSPLASVANEHGLIFRSDFNDAGFYAVLNNAAAQRIVTKMSDLQAPLFGSEVYEALAIQNARADVSTPLLGEYVPQMVNVQALNGIDFDKGCYMGQETVARTRFLGKNKRAAFSFCLSQQTTIAIGDTLEKQLGENWRRGGVIIRAAQLANETHFMAVLANDTTAQDVFRLSSLPEQHLCTLPLPYSIAQAPSNIVRKRT